MNRRRPSARWTTEAALPCRPFRWHARKAEIFRPATSAAPGHDRLLSVDEAPRPRDRYRPDRGIITLLFFIYRYAHKSDTQSVRRNLRIADPHKIEKIFF